jgi:hypothetical protein
MKNTIKQLITLFWCYTSTMSIGQTITPSSEMKNTFPVYKKNAEYKQGCISGDCNNGKGIYFDMNIWSMGDERGNNKVSRHVYLKFYIGKFEENGKVFTGKKYVHFTTIEYKAINSQRSQFVQSKNLDLTWFLEESSITKGIPTVEGRMIATIYNGGRTYLPDGNCTIRFMRHSLANETYAQLKGVYNKGIPEYVDISRYEKQTKFKAKVFSGLAISTEMYREGKIYSRVQNNNDLTDSTSYYMGELLGNIRHGRGFIVENGIVKQDGFWFLNKPVDMGQFNDEDFISYQNLQKGNLDNVFILDQTGQYTGTLQNNKPHGFGTFTNKWFTYHGYFKDGLPEGVGTFTLYEPQSGGGNIQYEVKTFVGVFKSGKFHKGQYAYVSLYHSRDYEYFKDLDTYSGYMGYYAMNGSIHSGTFNNSGLLEGNGSIDRISFYDYSSNRTNEYKITFMTYGNFKNGVLHGWGYTDVAGIVKHGNFENGQFVSGVQKEDYSRLKQGDVINVGDKKVYVKRSFKNIGGWTVELSDNQIYNYNFDFTRSNQNYSDFLEYYTCTSCKGEGKHTRKVKENYLPSYSVERYQLVTTTVIKTQYTHGKNATFDIESVCEQCNGTGKVVSIKKQLD